MSPEMVDFLPCRVLRTAASPHRVAGRTAGGPRSSTGGSGFKPMRGTSAGGRRQKHGGFIMHISTRFRALAGGTIAALGVFTLGGGLALTAGATSADAS